MRLYRISAVTLKVQDMEKSWDFYSKLPGMRLVVGGKTNSFSTFEVGKGSKMYINLELDGGDRDEERAEEERSDIDMSRGNVADTSFEIRPSKKARKGRSQRKDEFGRIIFHTEDVDALYQYMVTDDSISDNITFEGQPRDAGWGERFFQIIEPNGYELSFAQPIAKEKTSYFCE